MQQSQQLAQASAATAKYYATPTSQELLDTITNILQDRVYSAIEKGKDHFFADARVYEIADATGYRFCTVMDTLKQMVAAGQICEGKLGWRLFKESGEIAGHKVGADPFCKEYFFSFYKSSI